MKTNKTLAADSTANHKTSNSALNASILHVSFHLDDSLESDLEEPEPGGCSTNKAITQHDTLIPPLASSIISTIPEQALITDWLRLAYQKNQPAALSVAFVSKTYIHELNHRFREKDKATNVLSFPADLSDIHAASFDDLNETNHLLGDIVLCPEVILQEASEQEKPLNHHWAHMLIHGMLHLQGYDHIEDDEANIMEALEIQLLKSIDIPNPYIEF